MTARHLFNVTLISNGAVLEARLPKAAAVSFKRRYDSIGRMVRIDRACPLTSGGDCALESECKGVCGYSAAQGARKTP
jgi:hypothetical protein